MRYGRGAMPDGFLPVFSTDTEEEALDVVVATCSLGLDGNYYSPELAREQTLENLQMLGDKMEHVYQMIRPKPDSQKRSRKARSKAK